MTKQELELEWLKCAMDFEYFAETYLTTEDKKLETYVPFKLMPHQKGLIKLYNEHKHVITNKYRQSGITSVSCAYAAWLIIFNKNIKIGVVGNTLDHAKTELLKRISDFIDKLPNFLKIEPIKNSEKHKIYGNGCEIQARAATENGLRGFSPNFVIIDEFAFITEDDAFYNAAKSTWSTGGRCIIISTPNGSSNMFFKVYDLALQGKTSFKANELKWYHDIRLNTDLKWVSGSDEIIEFDHEKQKILILKGYKPTSSWYETESAGFNFDKKKIAQELEGNFLGSGGTYIDEEYLNKQELENVTKPNFYGGKDKNFWIWKYPSSPDEKFIFGIDVSSGVAEDYSTISVINMLTKEMYAEYCGKILPEDFADLIYEYTKIYNEPYLTIDVTGSYGIPVAQKLINTYEYKNIHYTEIKDRYIKDRLENEGNNDLRPGIVIGKNRLEILDAMLRGFTRDEIVVRSSRLIEELRGFKYVSGGRVDHKRGGTSDCIFGLAIALYVCDSDGTAISKALEKTKAMVSAWVVSNNNEEYYELEVKKRYENNEQNTTNKKIIPDIFFLF